MRKPNWKRRGLVQYMNPDEEKKTSIALVKQFHIGDKLPGFIKAIFAKFSGLDGFLKPATEQPQNKPQEAKV